MAKIYISICKNTILSNLKNGTDNPPIRVSQGKHGKPQRCHEYVFKDGDGRVVYSPDKPMPWGARVWIEVSGKIIRN